MGISLNEAFEILTDFAFSCRRQEASVWKVSGLKRSDYLPVNLNFVRILKNYMGIDSKGNVLIFFLDFNDEKNGEP